MKKTYTPFKNKFEGCSLVPERKIGQYGDKFNPTIRGLRAYEENVDHRALCVFWLVILSCWTFLTIYILINIQELPHPNPASEPRLTSIWLFLWLLISVLIWIGVIISFGKLRENETIMQFEKEKKI